MGQVSARGVRKSYGAVQVIKGIDLDARQTVSLVADASWALAFDDAGRLLP